MNPTRSAKSTDTSRRSATGSVAVAGCGAGVAASGVPHSPAELHRGRIRRAAGGTPTGERLAALAAELATGLVRGTAIRGRPSAQESTPRARRSGHLCSRNRLRLTPRARRPVASWSRRRAGRPPRRPRRPSRSGGRCRPPRATGRASARSRGALLWRAARKDELVTDDPVVLARGLPDAVDEHLELAADVARKLDAFRHGAVVECHPPVPRRFIITAAATAGLIVLVGVGFLALDRHRAAASSRSRRSAPTPPTSATSTCSSALRQRHLPGRDRPARPVRASVPQRRTPARGGRPADPRPPNLELTWTAVLVLILVAIADVHVLQAPRDRQRAGRRTSCPTIRIIGRQFYWQYEYPNGVVAIDTHARARRPRGERRVTAPDSDVIHSFWVPELGGKRDAIPGQENTASWYRRQEDGHLRRPLREFCGIQHALMRQRRGVEERRVRRGCAASRRGRRAGARPTSAARLGGRVREVPPSTRT